MKKSFNIKLLLITTFLFLFAGIFGSFKNNEIVNAASNTTYTVAYFNSGPKWTPSLPSTVNGGDAIYMNNQNDNVTIRLYDNGSYKKSVTAGWPENYDILTESRVTTEYNSSSGNYDINLISIYSIAYNNNGGTGSTTTINTKYAVGEAITLPDGTGLSKNGYTFSGWSKSSTATTGNTGSYTILKQDIVNNSITFYAVWTPITYNITYNLNNGTNGNNPSTYTPITETITLKDPTKDGYKFNGWYDNPQCSGSKISQIVKGSTGNKTLYADWKKLVTVTFNIGNNTYVYDKTSHSFISTLTDNLYDGSVKYASHKDGTHSDSDWSTTAPTNAGTYDIKVYRQEDSTYAELNEIYSSALIINPKEVGLSWTNYWLDYTGSSLKPTCTLSGLCDGDVCEVTVSGGKTEIGQGYSATASSLSNDNYKLPSNNTQEFDVRLPIVATNKTYAKTAYELEVNATDEIKNTFTYEYKLHTEDISKYTTTKPINAGIYDVRITRAASQNYNAYLVEEANYLIIYKKNLTYNWTNTRFIYDGNPHIPTVSITNLEAGDTCELTVTGTKTNYSDSPYYAIIESCSNDNYDITSNNKQSFYIYSETLYYNMSTGKLVYINPTETEFVATEYEDYYSVSDDFSTLTLKNINHVLDYNAYAFYIDTRVTVAPEQVETYPLTIILEGTNNLGCSSTGNRGVVLEGNVTIKGDGVLNISGNLYLHYAREITKNVLNVESGTINIEIVNDATDRTHVGLLSQNELNVTGGKITVYNPLKINTLFTLSKNNNFLLYAASDKNEELTLINKLDFDDTDVRYYSQYTTGNTTNKYYYAEFRPLTITQQPSLDNNLTIKTNVDSSYEWYCESNSIVPLTTGDVNEITDESGVEHSLDNTKGYIFSIEADEEPVMIVVLNDPQYSKVSFTTNKKLSTDFSRDNYAENQYNLLIFIKEEEGIYYYEAGLIFNDDDTPIGFFVCLLEDDQDTEFEINNVCYIETSKKIDNATSSSYTTPTETGNYYVVAKASFATAKSQSIPATTITYDLNGGSGTILAVTNYVGTVITLNDGSTISNNNLGFLGWNTNKNATTALPFTYTVSNEDITLYAIWTNKTTPTVTAPTAKSLTYNGNLQDLVNAAVTTGGTIKYSIGTTTTSGTYQTTIPQATNAGTYYVWYKVEGNNLYNAVEEQYITVTIDKLAVSEPTVSGSYIYNGNIQTVVLNGLENYMSTSDTLTKKDVGVYTITYTLDDNHTWNSLSDGIITWEIKPVSITPKQKDGEPVKEKKDVIVEAQEGFNNQVEVTVEVTVETEVVEATKNNKLTLDYYNIQQSNVKLSKNEKIGVVFDVKLIQTNNGVKTEINQTSLIGVSSIKVKMLIPDSVDTSKVVKILHVHNENDIDVIDFDKSKIVDGYYEIEVNKLSEFAFIYEEESSSAWVVILIILLVLIAAFITMFFIWKKEYETSIREYNKERKFKFLDAIYLPIYKLYLKLLKKTN